MNVTSFITKYYENKWQRKVRKNKPNSKPIKANLRKAKMNVNSLITKDYSNEQRTMNNERLCKTNPIKPNPPAPVFTPKTNIAGPKKYRNF